MNVHEESSNSSQLNESRSDQCEVLVLKRIEERCKQEFPNVKFNVCFGMFYDVTFDTMYLKCYKGGRVNLK